MQPTSFSSKVGVTVPLIAGPMYPCSNPELVGAVSKAGAMGVIQPVSLTYVHGHNFREGLKKVQELANHRPIGLNLLIETSSKFYLDLNRKWLLEALDEGVRFFITALGDPRWVVDIAKAKNAVVFHDVTEPKWAIKALSGGVDGLICVNKNAGGHAGTLSPEDLYLQLKEYNVPLICAGGIGDESDFVEALKMGYAGVQMGTRFIATTECTAHPDYKKAILDAEAEDIVMTKKITGVPVSVINTGFMKKRGTKTSFLADQFLGLKQTKHIARMFYTVRSLWQLKNSNKKGSEYKDYFQAGKSVGRIDKIEPVAAIVERFAKASEAFEEGGSFHSESVVKIIK